MPPSAPSWLRDLARPGLIPRRLRTVGLSMIVLVDMSYSVLAFDMRQALAEGTWTQPGRTMTDLGGVVSLIAFGLAIAVAWRQRFPITLTIAGCLAAITAVGPTVGLIGFMSVIICRSRLDALRLGPVVLVATAVAMWRDVHTEPRSMSFWASAFVGGGEPVPWALPTVLILVLVGGFAGMGAWLRARADLRTAEVVVAEERSAVSSLTDQVSRQAERERLAREIHDGLGHNLSILSVHAGALQAMAEASASEAPTGPATAQMKESAHVVRETAARSVAELQSLLDLLRAPDDADIAAPTKTLRDVRALIDDSVTAGMPLIATVFVDDGAALDPHIAQAAYRIVQELLTNARKHASTVSVRLSVTGGPAEGYLVIATANHLPPPTGPRSLSAADGEGGGRGLTGIRERVEHRGGDMQAGVDTDAVFRVSIRLPWRAPSPGSTKGNDDGAG